MRTSSGLPDEVSQLGFNARFVFAHPLEVLMRNDVIVISFLFALRNYCALAVKRSWPSRVRTSILATFALINTPCPYDAPVTCM